MDISATVLSVMVGIGLSAACGFRVFVPLLALSIASLTGHLHLADTFNWLNSYYALAALATATVVEVVAYYVPWLDNALDTIATPLAVVAGVLATAAVISGDVTPFLRWALAIIAGGGAATLVQGSSVLVRAKSSVFSGGTANAAVSTGELAGSAVTSILAILVPVLCVILVAVACFLIIRKLGRPIFRRVRSKGPETGNAV